MADLVTMCGIFKESKKMLFGIPGHTDFYVQYVFDPKVGEWKSKLVYTEPWAFSENAKFRVPWSHVVAISDEALDRWTIETGPFLAAAEETKWKPHAAEYVANWAKNLRRPFETLRTFRDELVVQGLRKEKAARAIQRAYREARDNPGYHMCKKRLLSEHAQLVS